MERLVDSGSWLSLQGTTPTSWVHHHQHLLSKEGRSLTPGFGGTDADCLPRAAPLPLPGLAGKEGTQFTSQDPESQCRAASCSCLLEPDAGSSFCLWALLVALASSLLFATVFFSLIWGWRETGKWNVSPVAPNPSSWPHQTLKLPW